MPLNVHFKLVKMVNSMSHVFTTKKQNRTTQPPVSAGSQVSQMKSRRQKSQVCAHASHGDSSQSPTPVALGLVTHLGMEELALSARLRCQSLTPALGILKALAAPVWRLLHL
jgi:hypothetical protein